MKDRLEELRRLSLPLEPGPEQRAEWTQQAVGWAEGFTDSLARGRAFHFSPDEGRGILEAPIADEPRQAQALLQILQEHVAVPGVKLGAPGFLAFIPISNLPTAALGDYLAAVANPFSGNFFASPGAVRLEHQLTRWMASFVGYPAKAAGDLTSGGSISNLSAIVTAREAHQLKARDFARVVVYLTSQAHHSIGKALRIAGLQECVQREVPLDDRWRMRADALDATIEADRKAGLLPWLIVAAAGSTDTGAVDPLREVAEIAQRQKLWLHVDGAYGAMFALCPSAKSVLAGLELSDSLTLDPHKGLFMPCGLGALLVRDGPALLRAYSYQAHYMRDRRSLASTDEVSPSELSPELTRPFRGLRLWLSLQLLGVRPFRAALEEKLLLARYFHDRIQRLPGFVVGPPPDLSVVTFRYVPERGDANEFNQRLLTALQRDGRIFLTSTQLDGLTVLRLAVLCATTHQDTIDLAVDLLARKSAELVAES